MKQNRRILYILNGDCMLEDWKSQGKINAEGTYVSCNEAMCWGEADEVIFGEAFVAKRVASLRSTQQMYEEIVQESLRPMIESNYDEVELWFGDDMFCQINMLTMMAYLEQIGFEGKVRLSIGCDYVEEFVPEIYEVSVEGSLKIYQTLVCHKKMPTSGMLPVTEQMATLYLNYTDAASEINRYIIHNQQQDQQVLVGELLKQFKYYGLGDMQYEMMIEAITQKQG